MEDRPRWRFAEIAWNQGRYSLWIPALLSDREAFGLADAIREAFRGAGLAVAVNVSPNRKTPMGEDAPGSIVLSSRVLLDLPPRSVVGVVDATVKEEVERVELEEQAERKRFADFKAELLNAD